ncbi:dihydroorotate dehydrogenase [Clostridium algidicarnis]|uniref:dihydroorotate dehydrogenase n=1 Tax=Clostridium algidicarnis TaxID=37659 RepID=UPI001C0AD7A2|nr:dihydroorotate dehydrogenase [Clostridium algidicarnis]MBU3195596.1 dihydroorotate dehydrogenase [Clostridium algidicarnis]MBU3208644.1 dihydroorotate dehydrogenase [Clostridium algidicarnis]MBU3226849.1 dihydroorotate dehydrogenase [Clostridium algidicarnis]MBU3250240.1 dihydroorotate dehydrogenase [Clostridium algidicarnis]
MMKININGIEFKNPVIAASGTFGFGQEYNDFYDVGKLGGICTKGLTLNPKEGNEGIRSYETPLGMLNSVGLQNIGVEEFVRSELPKMKKLNTNIIANLGGGSIDEYERAVEILNNSSVDMIELNISCPNVKEGGMAFGIKSKVAYDVVSRIKKISKKKIMVKLSPNAEDIVDIAYNCCMAGADSLSLINTLKGMAIDIKSKKPVFNNIFAGLSGPAVKPIALRMVYEVSSKVNIPVVGIGGIGSTEDALEFIMAGATAVQIGTANFYNPRVGIEVVNGIHKYMKEEGIKDLSEIRGIAQI